MTNKENYKNLSTFFNDEYHSLKTYVQSKVDDSTERDAEDIIQDVALRIFSRSDDSSPITNVAGFVYNSVKNKIIDVMRTKKEKVHESEGIDTKWAEFAELFYGSADNSYSEDLMNALKKAIQQLKPLYRDIIIAVDFEGYTYREIAAQTRISQGTLMSRRHRALSLLSNYLETEKIKMNKT
ncbi:RNA polymerase sigma factor [Flagellimonas pacifica]|uniref:RNA polymerase sigma-70 factor, ECF subfamily n=1 Tax=Flagellimonas pacifica TaxID=1247520 RepID=A0A285MET0_9FLAO|nr:RNA polymerase sigma factor [Allomuricauda parva]SNY95233.1 RNA polymerase sigma-70 factor, ECF subfamily [Allomuricauda parva]